MNSSEFSKFLDRTNSQYKALLTEIGMYKGQ